MAPTEFVELHVVPVFYKRAGKDAARRRNRQDVICRSVGNVHKRNLDFVVVAKSPTRVSLNDVARRECDDIAEYIAIRQAKGKRIRSAIGKSADGKAVAVNRAPGKRFF